MGRCFTCGNELGGGSQYLFHCPTCATVEEIGALREEVAENLAELAAIQEQGFRQLSAKLSEISSIMGWGFTELSWQLDQQRDILCSIDHTLKTPNETQAKELRQMAEELRERGVIDESEKRFLKSIELNPLDYRSYIGLALTYLNMGRFDDSKIFLEKSLPHAPKEKEFVVTKSLPEAPKEWVSTRGIRIDSEVIELLNNDRVEAIKLLRKKTSFGLLEAKEAVEEYEAHIDNVMLGSMSNAPKETVSTGKVLIDSEVRQLINGGHYQEAVLLVRNRKPIFSLIEAIDAVNDYIMDIVDVMIASTPKIESTFKIESTTKSTPAFDWESYSYKLIGRILFCQENYIGAVEALKHSIQLSPQYASGHYDYAQYCALVGKVEDCLASLKTAIMLEPFSHNLASKERNFDSVRNEVQQLLDSLLPKELMDRANGIIAKWYDELQQIDEVINQAHNSVFSVHNFSKVEYEDFLRDNKKKYGKYGAAYKLFDATKKETDTARIMLSEMKQAVESRNYANIIAIALEATELPKLVNHSRAASNKAVVIASCVANKSSGCLLSLIVSAVSLALVGMYLFTILTLSP